MIGYEKEPQLKLSGDELLVDWMTIHMMNTKYGGWQYCNECNLMFNLPSRILHPIDKLLKSEEEAKLIIEDMLFQEPNEAIKTKQYLAYPDLSKELELK
ncbi:hypothetical protein G9A89_016778 [Geosiphon pyriformis]|nr:hypothetical protein G9A89_016778 [Geosiphon pyriformis]